MKSNRFFLRSTLVAAVTIFCAGLPASMQAQGQAPAVEPASQDLFEITFNNTLPYTADLYWLDLQTGESVLYANIPAGAAHPQGTYAGHVWQIGVNGELVDEFYTEEALEMVDEGGTLDLAAFMNRPILVVVSFFNNLEETVEIFWVDEEGNEESYGEIPANLSLPMESYAGHHWKVKKKDGEVLFDYYASDVDEMVDVAAFASMLPLNLKNSTGAPAQVFFVDTSTNPPTPVFYGDLPAGGTYEAMSFPGHIWDIQVYGRSIGQITVSEEMKEVYDVNEMDPSIMQPR